MQSGFFLLTTYYIKNQVDNLADPNWCFHRSYTWCYSNIHEIFFL